MDMSNNVHFAIGRVEVRENQAKGERYQVVLHHADGSEDVVAFKGRNKFIYLVALLIAHEGESVFGLTTSHFAYMRNSLSDMARNMRVNVNSYEEWIDEFIYAERAESVALRKEKDFKEMYCSLFPYKYSNAFSGANKAIRACCTSEAEYETFKLSSTGGRWAVTTMSLDTSQIVLPHSLAVYQDCLPTRNDLCHFKLEKAKWLPVKN